MQLFWGDIHNHCDISYGYGSLENALDNALQQLDFCAVTGHAMWPDMFKRTDETAFLIDYHNHGFSRLKDHWQEVKKQVAGANTEALVTFQAYEMHSTKYGDHHIVSPDDTLPLLYMDSPYELKRNVGCRSLLAAHHIGYRKGYRGIDWDLHDETDTPLVEVCSKHGCAMNEPGPNPYYHDMGPRDDRNTVYEGLRRGHRFGFLGSSDHHAGFPGSYGDGRTAVLSKAKTRDSIWDALVNRRVYAVTGDKIQCSFTLNDAPMGTIMSGQNAKRCVAYDVYACYPIDRVILFRNCQPIEIIDGIELKQTSDTGRYKFRIEMGWGVNVDTLFAWHGQVTVTGGCIVSVEPCFRGRSVLAPNIIADTYQGDCNRFDNRVVHMSEERVDFICSTVRNLSTLHPQTDALIFEIDGVHDTRINITVNDIERSITLRDLSHHGFVEYTKLYPSQAIKVHPAVHESCLHISGEYTETVGTQNDFYHMEVSQRNGQYAFVSPIFISS